MILPASPRPLAAPPRDPRGLLNHGHLLVPGVTVRAVYYHPGGPDRQTMHVQLVSSWWTGWRIDRYTFPEMQLRHSVRLGWRKKNAINIWERQIAVFEAVKALGVSFGAKL